MPPTFIIGYPDLVGRILYCIRRTFFFTQTLSPAHTTMIRSLSTVKVKLVEAKRSPRNRYLTSYLV